jgi:hypothetical protein
VILEEETDRLSRNVGTELPLYDELYLRRPHIWSTTLRKPEIRQSNNHVPARLRRCVASLSTRRPGFEPKVILVGSVVHKATLDEISSKCFSFSLKFTIPQLLATRIWPTAGTVDPFEAEVPRDLVPLHSFTSLPPNSNYHGHLPT